MDRQHWELVESVFHAAVDRPSADRRAYVEQRCGGNAEAAREVLSLLDAYEEQESLTRPSEPPAFGDTAVGRDFGPWRAERLIGRGGMAAVYLARRADGQFERKVALKILSASPLSPLLGERFRIERQAMAALVHANIARLLDGGVTASGVLYLVMEYVDGVPVDRYCRDAGLGLTARLRLFLEIAAAVQYAHQHLVVHRDLKPDNILVESDGTPKLLDFGMAKFLVNLHPAHLDTTQLGLQGFTPRYASPEQILGRPVSTAVDIYSLGVLLHVLLTGRHPYEIKTGSLAELIAVVCHGEPAAPSSHMQWPKAIAADLDAIVGKALRKEPAARYRSVAELCGDIERFLDGRPVLAHEGSARYRAAKFLRRNRASVSALAAALALILAGSAGVFWQYRNAAIERSRAEAHDRNARSLTNSLVFELYDAVSRLPQSRQAQNLLIGRSLELLDRMARDGPEDESLESDLMEAYIRLGLILGDRARAIESVRNALRLAGERLSRRPGDTEALRYTGKAKGVLGELLFEQGQVDRAVVSAREGCDLLLRLEAGEEAAECLVRLGGIQAHVDPVRARESFERSLTLYQRAGKQHALALARSRLGDLDCHTNPRVASANYRESLRLLASITGFKNNPVDRRLSASIRTRLAGALLALGESGPAEAELHRAIAIYQTFLAYDPADTPAQLDLASVYLQAAAVREAARDEAGGRGYIQEASRILDAVLERRPEDGAAQVLEARTMLKRGPRSERSIEVLKEHAAGATARGAEFLRAVRALVPIEPQAAAAGARRAIEAAPFDPAPRLILVEALQAEGDMEAAHKVASEALTLFPPDQPQEDISVIRRRLEQAASFRRLR